MNLIAKPCLHAASFVSIRWYKFIKQMTLSRLPMDKQKCKWACYEGDFLAVVYASRIEPFHFHRSIEYAGRGGRKKVGEWLLSKNIGDKAQFCYGACRGNQTRLIDIYLPQLNREEQIEAIYYALRGANLDLAKRIHSTALPDWNDTDYIKAAFRSGDVATVMFLEEHFTDKILFWEWGMYHGLVYKHWHLMELALQKGVSDKGIQFCMGPAMSSGNKNLVDRLIELGAKITDSNIDDAFYSGSAEMISLVSQFENVEWYWDSAYEGAAKGGHVNLLQTLYEKQPRYLSVYKIICRAGHHGHFNVLHWALNKGLEEFHWQMVIGALESGHLEWVQEFLKQQRDYLKRPGTNTYRYTCSHMRKRHEESNTWLWRIWDSLPLYPKCERKTLNDATPLQDGNY